MAEPFEAYADWVDAVAIVERGTQFRFGCRGQYFLHDLAMNVHIAVKPLLGDDIVVSLRQTRPASLDFALGCER